MGWFSSLIGSGSFLSQSETPEDNATYKKYTAEINNFELDPKLVKQSVSSKNSSLQLSQIQDDLNEIDSLDDVKQHFQEK